MRAFKTAFADVEENPDWRRLMPSHRAPEMESLLHGGRVDLCAGLLARNLYYRRFFPYSTGAILAGIDEHGRRLLVRSHRLQRLPYSASGAAEPMLTPFIDCQVGHVTLSEGTERPNLTLERATACPVCFHSLIRRTSFHSIRQLQWTKRKLLLLISPIVRDAFRGCAEREITTGDSIHLVIAEAGKPIRHKRRKLRED